MARPTIAVVGASLDRRKFGNKCVRAHADQGFEVFPLHPTEPEIEGHRAYAKLADLPVDRLDRISVYLPAEVCLKVLPELTAKPAAQFWLNPGADDPRVVARARELGLPVVIGCSIVDLGVSPPD